MNFSQAKRALRDAVKPFNCVFAAFELKTPIDLEPSYRKPNTLYFSVGHVPAFDKIYGHVSVLHNNKIRTADINGSITEEDTRRFIVRWLRRLTHPSPEDDAPPECTVCLEEWPKNAINCPKCDTVVCFSCVFTMSTPMDVAGGHKMSCPVCRYDNAVAFPSYVLETPDPVATMHFVHFQLTNREANRDANEDVFHQIRSIRTVSEFLMCNLFDMRTKTFAIRHLRQSIQNQQRQIIGITHLVTPLTTPDEVLRFMVCPDKRMYFDRMSRQCVAV